MVKKSKQNFNELSTDQALEHVNKICKSVGGFVGITREDSTRDRWCLTYNHRSQVSVNTMKCLVSVALIRSTLHGKQKSHVS